MHHTSHIEINNTALEKNIEFIKNDASLKVRFLTNLGAVHYPENTDKEIAIVYHLHSLENNFRIRLKTYIPISKPEIKSIVD